MGQVGVDGRRVTAVSLPVLWREHRGVLWRLVRRRVPTSEDAEDVLQEVWLTAHRKLHQLEEAHKARAWLCGVARSRVVDFYRRRRPTEPLTPDRVERLAAPPRATGMDETGTAGCFSAILAAMPEHYREAVVLIDLEGCTSTELATRTALSIPGAKSRVQRGRRMLRAGIEECLELEFDAVGHLCGSEFRRHDCRFCSRCR